MMLCLERTEREHSCLSEVTEFGVSVLYLVLTCQGLDYYLVIMEAK